MQDYIVAYNMVDGSGLVQTIREWPGAKVDLIESLINDDYSYHFDPEKGITRVINNRNVLFMEVTEKK